jgi:DNA-binding NtrC family response regulator
VQHDARSRRLRRVLVVEDHRELRALLARFLRERGLHVLEACSAREAMRMLAPPPDLILLDVRLPDGSVFPVLEASASLWPAPIKIALSGAATPEDAFRLARYGVRRYLQKPVSLAALEEAIAAACEEQPDLRPLVQDSVGHVSVRELQRDVRSVMLRQAMAIAKGNRSNTARLLRVSRQAVQQFLRRRVRRKR